VALVSAKPAEHFRTSPGGYFHGMVQKAKAGELNLMGRSGGCGRRRPPGSARGGRCIEADGDRTGAA
jgi:replication initiation protein RepC